MTKTTTATLVISIGMMTACSSQMFTSATADSGSSTGGSNTGGSRSTGGASGASGKSGTGGATSTGGITGTGAIGASGGPGSTGGTSAGGGSSTDSGVISTEGGGVSSDSGVISSDGGGVSGVQCVAPNPTFPTFEKGCTNDASCAIARHRTGCCGPELFMGINHAELTRFQAAESICDSQYPPCNCPPTNAKAEDGTLVPAGSESLIVVACNNGLCQTHYSGKTFACGTMTCTDQEFCSAFTGGPAGSPTSYSCNSLGGCSSCSCISSTGCVCSQDQGFIRVSCAAP